MIDVETNQILGLEVTDEAVQDDRMFVPLLDQVQQHCDGEHPVHRVLGDGAYDRNELFNAPENRKILAGIRTRVDAAAHSTGSPYRAQYSTKLSSSLLLFGFAPPTFIQTGCRRTGIPFTIPIDARIASQVITME